MRQCHSNDVWGIIRIQGDKVFQVSCVYHALHNKQQETHLPGTVVTLMKVESWSRGSKIHHCTLIFITPSSWKRHHSFKNYYYYYYYKNFVIVIAFIRAIYRNNELSLIVFLLPKVPPLTRGCFYICKWMQVCGTGERNPGINGKLLS